MSPSPVSVFWFRRDLRIDDNHGLFECLQAANKRGHAVLPIFIFDHHILRELPHDDHRVSFIHYWLKDLERELEKQGSKLFVYQGTPAEVFQGLIKRNKIASIFTNEDYEPRAIARDQEIAKLAAHHGIEFKTFKDQVVFAKAEITKDDGSPYRMFTPYSRKWLAAFATQQLPTYSSRKLIAPSRLIFEKQAARLPSLKDLGFLPAKIPLPQHNISAALIKNYGARRNFLNLRATSHIGAALRFGTISIRSCIKTAEKFSEVWLKELIWREFFQQILFHYPHTVNEPFDSRFKKFPWRGLTDFDAWKSGATGYPIVDAGMRELNQTGFMHNRARMIVGSFLTKHLLIDWRHGERYFAEKLFDFELASNVGNWQWVAGTGCDAAPYFRIFNPALQAKKFDQAGEYVKKWVPELGTDAYPEPIVDHEHARRRALSAYAKVKLEKKT